MLTEPKSQKRPADVIGDAARVMQIATGEIDEAAPIDDGKDPAAKVLGAKGGAARAKAMSPARRAEIAKYRTKEPIPIKPETSQIWRKVFSELRGEGVGMQTLAYELLGPPSEIVSLVFGLVTIGLPSSSTSSPSAPKARLTLVK